MAYSRIIASTKAIFFFGTPHRGSYALETNKLSVLEKVAKVAFHEIPANLRSALKPRANELFAINGDFVSVKGSIQIVNFFEQKEMRYLGELVCIFFVHPSFKVPKALACKTNHADTICRLSIKTLLLCMLKMRKMFRLRGIIENSSATRAKAKMHINLLLKQ